MHVYEVKFAPPLIYQAQGEIAVTRNPQIY